MDKRNFTEVVKGIESAERDVDKVLGAGRLERHEGPSNKLSAEQKTYLLVMLMACVTFLCALQIGCYVM